MDPRYRMLDETVLGFAAVTADEERLEFMRPLERLSIQKAWKAKTPAETRRITRTRSDRASSTTGHDKAGLTAMRQAEAASRIARAHALHADGLSVADITREMSQSPRVIRTYLAKPPIPEPIIIPQPTPRAVLTVDAPAASRIVRPQIESKPEPFRLRLPPVSIRPRIYDATAIYLVQRFVIQDGCSIEEAAERLRIPVDDARAILNTSRAA